MNTIRWQPNPPDGYEYCKVKALFTFPPVIYCRGTDDDYQKAGTSADPEPSIEWIETKEKMTRDGWQFQGIDFADFGIFKRLLPKNGT